MKTLLVPIAIIGIILVSFFVFRSTQKTSVSDTMTPKNEALQKETGSRYVEYTKTNFDNAKNTRRVLFFYANWCPTCRPADTSFSQNESQIPTDVTLIRANYNDTETDKEEKDLAAKYGVTYQHTFVQIDENGNAVTKWNGGQINELLQKIK